MEIEAIRIQNFRCVRDSGKITLSPRVTFLIGENESGKSAILDALTQFRFGESFRDVDISTFSGVRTQLEAKALTRAQVDMVTIWVSISAEEETQIAQDGLNGFTHLEVTKRLDNSYAVLTTNGRPLAEALTELGSERLLKYLKELLQRMQGIYVGRIVRKEYYDKFVFIERTPGEKDTDNLILYPEAAGATWDLLHAEDTVQVTKISDHPFQQGNRRAMNVGLEWEVYSEIAEVMRAALGGESELSSAIDSLRSKVSTLPIDHPLQEYINLGVVKNIESLRPSSDPNKSALHIETQVVYSVPWFLMYEPHGISDTLPLDELSARTNTRDGLATLIEHVGLQPRVVFGREPAERMKILAEKKAALAGLITEHWVRDVDVQLESLNQDQEIGLGVSSLGSLDPPSRRSQGFNDYLSLLSALLDMQMRSGQGVLLLDDPGMNLHPSAQKKLSTLLESQLYQIIVATHLPFMMDPERLENVRLITRSSAGTVLESDWGRAPDGILPVLGALGPRLAGRIPLLVEGKSDCEYLEVASATLQKIGEHALSKALTPLPGGGGQLPHLAQALHSMGIPFLLLVDGDPGGATIASQVKEFCGTPDARIITMREALRGGKSMKIEDLFSPSFKNSKTVLDKGLSAAVKSAEEFDVDTVANFKLLIDAINKSIATVLPSQQ